MSYDWWAILQDDAQKRGPQAVHLVETVGQARAMAILDGRAAKSYDNFLNGLPAPQKPKSNNLFDVVEAELKKALELRPNRLHFPSEGITYPDDK